MSLALIVVANPSTSSLSHAMAAAAERVLSAHGYKIAFHDLYAERFDPVQPTAKMRPNPFIEGQAGGLPERISGSLGGYGEAADAGVKAD